MTLMTSVNDFLSHCLYDKRLSRKTIKAYKIDLCQFSSFVKEIELLYAISKNEIRNYLISISNLKPRTIKRKSASLKTFFNYLEFEDLITVNPFRKMRVKIKEPQVLLSVMDLTEIKKIFKTCYRSKSEIEDKTSSLYKRALLNIVIIELLFATGARVSEVANLKKSNINFRSGNVVIKGKGNKERTIQICNSETLRILDEYCSLNETQIINSGGWLLINRHGRNLSDQSIRNIVKQICSKAGFKRRITPHSFRHTFGTLLLEKNVDIRYIQSMLGHSSIMTTQIYTHVNNKRQRQILASKHPRRDFSF